MSVESKLSREFACPPILPVPVLVAVTFTHTKAEWPAHMADELLQFLYFDKVSSLLLSPQVHSHYVAGLGS